jgi:hypothetical protein
VYGVGIRRKLAFFRSKDG